MGKIIRNGIKYSGTTNSADKINYNNTLSGLEAETAQEAFDELNTKIKNGGSNIRYLTQEEYDALPESKESDDVEYRITNANESVNAARDWAYDNTASGLEAENVQDAIDEVNENVSTLRESLDTVKVFTTTAYGLTLLINKVGRVCEWKLTGKTTEELTKGTYYIIADLLNTDYEPIMQYVNITTLNSEYVGQVQARKYSDTNKVFEVGFFYKSGVSSALPSGTSIFAHGTYISKN